MQYQIYQWIGPLIGLFFISRTVYQYLHNRRSASSTLVWTVFWVAVMALAVFPDIVTVLLAKRLGFASNVTAIIFVSIAMLFVFVFYISSTIERLELQVTELVRKLALEQAEKEKLLKEKEQKRQKRKHKVK